MASTRNSIKDELRAKIIRRNGFQIKTRAVILLDVSDLECRSWLLQAGSVLDISFVSSPLSQEGESEFAGFDAVVSDLKNTNLNFVELIKAGVVPIIPKENSFEKSFSEFDPMKFLGNAFLYEKATPFHIFEKVIRYLENVRYPGDKRTLLSNVEKTF